MDIKQLSAESEQKLEELVIKYDKFNATRRKYIKKATELDELCKKIEDEMDLVLSKAEAE